MMAESDAGKTTLDSTDIGDQSRESFQINISKEHGNWLTVGELIRSIQKPISIYAEIIVKAFHEKLCKDLLSTGKCTSPNDCNKKTRSTDLCPSCQGWFKELAKSHEKGNNPFWHKNCNSVRWSEDHWEVAKFFMPALGNNQSTVKDAESTDLPSLLNVLEWMKSTAFLGKTRVNVDLVRKLRSEVRNTWAHAPKQEISDDVKAESFLIATEFLEDLEKVFSKPENEECLKHLKDLQDNGVSNVAESELQSLLLQRQLLYNIKDEITRLKDEQFSDRRAIEDHKQKLKKLECALSECSNRMSDFESLKDNINKQFSNFAEDLKSFRAIPDDIHEIRDSIGQIRDDLAKMNNRQNVQREPTSCLPEKVPMFTARGDEIQKVISFLMDEEKAIVSLYGGPGFGKTAIAVEVSHKLSGDHDITVVFSDLRTATTVDEMIRQLCLDVGVNHEDDPKSSPRSSPRSSLIFWLKNIKKKAVFVLDDIDNLLEEKTDLYDFFRLMRKNSNQHCQVVTTSRSSYTISELSTAKVQVSEMENEACMTLLKQQCRAQEGNFLTRLAALCGKIPLAMCIASSLIDDFKNPDELLQYLEDKPIDTLGCPESDKYVYRAINMSYEKLDDDQKEAFARLAVFEGSFDAEAARAVMEKKDLHSKCILKNLVTRSLIKKETKLRYSVHLLIKHFLSKKLTSLGETTRMERAEASRVQALMVGHYLDLADKLTIKSYSKDGYKTSREDLKEEVHNIQEVLQICSKKKDTTSDISNSLANSKIYTKSAKYFAMFVRTIIPGSIVDEFLQCCAKLAKERNELALKINFECLLADEERIKSFGKSDKIFKDKIEAITNEFEMHYDDLKEQKSLCAQYHYQYGRYLSRKSEKVRGKKGLSLVRQAREQLEKSLDLRKTLTDTPVGKADKIFALLCLGKICKFTSTCENSLKKKKESKESIEQSQTYYKEAMELSRNNLGEHELTSACYKSLGDLFFKRDQFDTAEKNYTIAKEMREKLGLDTSEKQVYLLNNLGKCWTNTERVSEAIQLLENVRDMAEKLAENDQPKATTAKVYTSLAIAYDLRCDYQDSEKYARKALEFKQIQKVVKTSDFYKLKQILKSSDVNGQLSPEIGSDI